MLNQVSVKLTEKMLKRVKNIRFGIDVYVYGIEIILSTIVEIIAILVFSLCLSDIIDGLLFLLLFMSLRTFTGGYHAKTYRKCFCVTLTSFLCVLYIRNWIVNIYFDEICYVFLILICVYIIYRAPIINERQPLSKIKIVKNGKMAAICLLLDVAVVFILAQLDRKLMYLAILTVCLVAALMLITDIFVILRGGTKNGNYC